MAWHEIRASASLRMREAILRLPGGTPRSGNLLLKIIVYFPLWGGGKQQGTCKNEATQVVIFLSHGRPPGTITVTE